MSNLIRILPHLSGSGSSPSSDSEDYTDFSPIKLADNDLGLSPMRLLPALAASIEEAETQQNAQDEDEDVGPFATEVSRTPRRTRVPKRLSQNLTVCRKAFKIIFCVGNSRLQRLRLQDKHPASIDTVARQPSAEAFILLEWLDSFFLSHCERQPADGKYHLPNNFTKKEVYDHYRTDMVQVQRMSSVLIIQKLLAEAVEALKLHRKQQAEERAAAGRRRWKALDSPKDCAYIQIDGMDQKKTALPHFSKQPKSVDGAALVGVHLVGAMIFHGKLLPPERDACSRRPVAVTTTEEFRRRIFGQRRPIYSGPRRLHQVRQQRIALRT
ncbi:hypothetical protein R1sor_001671 [Riccia sorocarpa]|uniref:Uncharacterized protein n=1 Tax=Riccia sorocarpa TaxID=122646 RepID=A0ABD3H0L1_9MARC